MPSCEESADDVVGAGPTGLRDMPSNAAWLLSRALKPAEAVGDAAESATAAARDRGREVTAAVLDATPVGGDSVDVRMRRARESAERAREAEEQAVEAAQESKERSDHARRVSERGRARMTEVDRETTPAGQAARRRGREGRQRGGAARPPGGRGGGRGAAPGHPGRDRRRARRRAARRRRGPRAREELVADATAKLAEARRLAEEATQAARAAAEKAHRQAQELADEAEQQAGDAEARIEAAERLRKEHRDDREDHRAGAQAHAAERRAGLVPQAGARRARVRHRHRGTEHHDQGPTRGRDREGVAQGLNGGRRTMRIPNPFNRKSTLDRFFDALDDSLGAAADLPSSVPRRIGSHKTKAGLIAAGGVGEPHRRQLRHFRARRRLEGPQGGS